MLKKGAELCVTYQNDLLKKRVENLCSSKNVPQILKCDVSDSNDIDNLYIKEAYVGKSIVLKRFRARAKGRASGIKKPYSNLTIILSENNKKKEELHGSKS